MRYTRPSWCVGVDISSSRCVLNHLPGAAFPDATFRQRCTRPKQSPRINNSDTRASILLMRQFSKPCSGTLSIRDSPSCERLHKSWFLAAIIVFVLSKLDDRTCYRAQIGDIDRSSARLYSQRRSLAGVGSFMCDPGAML